MRLPLWFSRVWLLTIILLAAGATPVRRPSSPVWSSPFLLQTAQAQDEDDDEEVEPDDEDDETPPPPTNPATVSPEQRLQVELNTALNKNDWETVKKLVEANPALLKPPVRVNRYDSNYGSPSILMRAVRSGKTDIVSFLLEKGANPNLKGYGDSALVTSLSLPNNKWKEMADLLLAKGADVNLMDGQGNTPLTHVLSDGGEKSRLEWLLAKGASVTLRQRNGRSPIEIALTNTSVDIFRLLLPKADVKQRDAHNATLLHLAVAHDRLEPARLLIAAGVPLNAQNERGETALHLLDNNRDAALLKLLLDSGANPNLKSDRGDLPLHILLRWPALHTTPINVSDEDDEMDFGDEEDETPVEPSGALRGALLAPLIDKTDLSIRDRFGLSPLLLALEARNQEARDLIMERAPKLDSTTQLFDAAASGNLAALETLLKAKPLLAYFRLPDGTTPLHISALWGSLSASQALLARGADVNARNASGETPLHAALMHPDGLYLRRAKNLVPVLMAKRADPGATDILDRTPLHLAASTNEPDLVNLLLVPNAGINRKNSQGKTPLMLAIGAGSSLPLVQNLLAKGANPNLGPSESTNALTAAIAVRRLDIVKALFAKGAVIPAETQSAGDEDGSSLLGRLVSGIEENDGEGVDDALALFSLLLTKGADPNGKIEGQSLVPHLIAANESYNQPFLKALLATKKVPLGATTERGALLSLAVKRGNIEATRTLLEAGADINEKDEEGHTPLFIARNRKQKEIITLLTAKGAKE